MARYSGTAWRSFRPGATVATAVASVTHAPALRPGVRCRILGLDPGSRRTGFGLIDSDRLGMRHLASGCISASENDLALRLKRIYAAVRDLIDEHQPDEIAIERAFVHRNPDSALKLGQARGAALCAAVSAGANAFEYAPRAVKLAVTGFGAAEKPQVAMMVTTLLALAERPLADAADALAVALCHAQGRRLLQIRGQAR